jgi:septal ring factor EnvC (AmiA/AmiB activator)
MDVKSFAKLEEQINRAIAHIERMTAQAIKLESENQELKDKIVKLERELKSRNEMLLQMEGESTRVAEQMREKIESILSRIDHYEKGTE